MQLQPVPKDEPKSWHIQQQGLKTRQLQLDVTPYGESYVVTVEATSKHKIFFDTAGRMSHIVRVHDDAPALAATAK